MFWELDPLWQNFLDPLMYSLVSCHTKNTWFTQHCHNVLYHLGDNCFQNFHLGRLISQKLSFTVTPLECRYKKTTYSDQYFSLNETFKYGYRHSNALLRFRLKLECCKPHTSCPTKGCAILTLGLTGVVCSDWVCHKPHVDSRDQVSRYECVNDLHSIFLFHN